MAAHSLSIAKASLLASCLRAEHTKLGRDDLTDFHSLLETVILRCTPSNIQNTKAWLLRHILPSTSRSAAWSKYVASLSKNIDSLPETNAQCRSCRRQLHILYLINDIFHHAKYHNQEALLRKNVEDNILPILPTLFGRAAVEGKKRTVIRLKTLLDIWEKANYCSREILGNLRVVMSSGLSHSDNTAQDETKASAKELPYIMPSTHGDSNAPFFDLPAANLMPHIIPNSTRPLRTGDIRALQMQPGPADESLVNALKDFLKDVKSIDDPYAALEDEGIVPDMDEMGQVFYKNEVEDVTGDTYYGWSRAFCEKMKARSQNNSDPQRGRSRSSNSSMSRSRSPRKRTRYSSSRSRSRSSFRERPPLRPSQDLRQESPFRKRRSATPEPPPRFGNGNGYGSESTERPRPPPLPSIISSQVPSTNTGARTFRPPPVGPNGMPQMPPRPPNWQGPWPPPPPPPSMGFPAQNFGHQNHYGK